jgi:hypothetical protein
MEQMQQQMMEEGFDDGGVEEHTDMEEEKT